MRTATVTLDGKEYVIEELRAVANREWRDEMEKNFSEIVSVLREDVDTSDGLANIVSTISRKVLGCVDIAVDLVRLYAPSLPLDDVYESEIIEVFWSVLGLAYPFGFEKLAQRILGLVQRGQAQVSTKLS